ncbi:MAG TPA: bifunctional 3-hydroxydecanoyl-ACP dehydratase/trans-2-decenoyl-ACP isomerase, partial [Syntrophales bacterium]|nr:bifunctional 3-hydroxydecanoyl-ACP dehydratase/trans-2-decenoyl-ACP isomerase [Syntrophales bacterium]
MTYREFMDRDHFDLTEILAIVYGNLVSDAPQGMDAKLPAPPLLMVDRILSITKDNRHGAIVAEQDVRLDAWYFQCHLPGDPVQPGCLCVDAVWQLLGFYCLWR